MSIIRLFGSQLYFINPAGWDSYATVTTINKT